VFLPPACRLGLALGLSLLLLLVGLPGIGRADDDDNKKNIDATQNRVMLRWSGAEPPTGTPGTQARDTRSE